MQGFRVVRLEGGEWFCTWTWRAPRAEAWERCPVSRAQIPRIATQMAHGPNIGWTWRLWYASRHVANVRFKHNFTVRPRYACGILPPPKHLILGFEMQIDPCASPLLTYRGWMGDCIWMLSHGICSSPVAVGSVFPTVSLSFTSGRKHIMSGLPLLDFFDSLMGWGARQVKLLCWLQKLKTPQSTSRS